MAILKPEPPRETAETFSRMLPAFLSVPEESGELRRGFAGQPPAIPTLNDLRIAEQPDSLLHDPQQAFILDLEDAAGNAGTRAARPTGWRIFAGRLPGKTVLGRVARRRESGWKLTAAFYGDNAWVELNASEALDRLPQVSQADYELRVLAVPGLNLQAFWLVARTPGVEDLAIPFPRRQASSDSPEVLTMANFLASIRQKALIAARANAGYGG